MHQDLSLDCSYWQNRPILICSIAITQDEKCEIVIALRESVRNYCGLCLCQQ